MTSETARYPARGPLSGSLEPGPELGRYKGREMVHFRRAGTASATTASQVIGVPHPIGMRTLMFGPTSSCVGSDVATRRGSHDRRDLLRRGVITRCQWRRAIR
jgi:hypothetical protein